MLGFISFKRERKTLDFINSLEPPKCKSQNIVMLNANLPLPIMTSKAVLWVKLNMTQVSIIKYY